MRLGTVRLHFRPDACAIRRIANDATPTGATNGLAHSCEGDETVDTLVVDGKRR